LAIDQAKTAGYALFCDKELETHGVVELGLKNKVYEDILFHAQQKIKELIANLKAEYVVIEDIQQQNRNVTTYKKLAMLMGSILCLLQEMDIPHMVVPPSKWKSYCGIKGKKRAEQKANTISFVETQFGLAGISEDMADAICLGWYGVHNMDNEKGVAR